MERRKIGDGEKKKKIRIKRNTIQKGGSWNNKQKSQNGREKRKVKRGEKTTLLQRDINKWDANKMNSRSQDSLKKI